MVLGKNIITLVVIWKKGDGRLSPKHSPINKLSEVERQRIIHICKQPEYANLSPCSLVPVLADQGIYRL